MKQQATPYLIFSGNAKEALNYYKEIFGGEITEMQTFGEADFPTPPEMDDRVMHAQFRKGGLFLMVSDSFDTQPINVGNNISLALELDSQEEIESLYAKLNNDGKVLMELQDTFWGAKYAKVQDPYGITWDLNYQKS